MKKLSIALFLLLSTSLHAQQFSLYNSGTLYDSFENPTQRIFKMDTTRSYSSNFLIPNGGFNTTFKGPAQTALNKILFEGGNSEYADGLPLNSQVNNLYLTGNDYVAMFRILRGAYSGNEIGFSWQVRSDTHAEITNATIGITRSPTFLPSPLDQSFNNKLFTQTYHQIGFTYRENINTRLSLGVKLSYLSGINYTDLDLISTNYHRDTIRNVSQNVIGLRGTLMSTFKYRDLDTKDALPGFKNPGAAITASMNYKFRDGWDLTANLKDMGMIKWSNQSYLYDFDVNAIIPNNGAMKALDEQVKTILEDSYKQESFTKPINGKVELMLHKNWDVYQPNLLVSYQVFYPGTNIALINSWRFNAFNVSVSTAYNTNKTFQAGGMLMYKSSNAEVFLGTDQIIQSYNSFKGYRKDDGTIGSGGYSGASAYFGIAIKFGSVLSAQTTNTIPGFSKNKFDNPGLFRRILGNERYNGTSNKGVSSKGSNLIR